MEESDGSEEYLETNFSSILGDPIVRPGHSPPVDRL